LNAPNNQVWITPGLKGAMGALLAASMPKLIHWRVDSGLMIASTHKREAA
jgi:hypothetical protein